MNINFSSKRFILFLIIIGFAWAILINETNLAYIKSENPENKTSNSSSTVYGYTVWNIDNEWYLPQIKNILSGNGYTLDTRDPKFSVRRTPVYPLFYGLHYIIFGEEYSFFVIRYTQLLIHILAILLLGQAIYNLSGDSKWAKLVSIFYAINPFTIPFLYFTITESLTPSFIIFVIFAFSLCYLKGSYKHFFFLGFITAFSILNRPLLILLAPAICVALLVLVLKEKGLNSLNLAKIYPFLFVFLGFATVFSPWVIRNYFSTGGNFVLLERYYYDDQMDYGPGHMKFREWIGNWENPANFLPEDYSNEVRNSYKSGKKDVSAITDKFVGLMPESLFKVNSKEQIYDALNSINACFAEKEEVFRQNPDITIKEQYELFACESEVSRKFQTLSDEYRSKAPLNYYVLVPSKFVSSLIFQSGSYHYAILNPPSGKLTLIPWAAKAFMYLLNVSLFFSFFLFTALNFRKDSAFVVLCSVFLLGTFWYLIYINRYSEARYLIPLYPMLYSGLTFCIISVFGKFYPSKS